MSSFSWLYLCLSLGLAFGSDSHKVPGGGVLHNMSKGKRAGSRQSICDSRGGLGRAEHILCVAGSLGGWQRGIISGPVKGSPGDVVDLIVL